MSDLNISQKDIYSIFSERGVKFFIPDYQRPYYEKMRNCITLPKSTMILPKMIFGKEKI